MTIDLRHDRIRRTALDWTMRVQDPDFAGWDDLTAWLEADARHSATFDQLTLRDAEVADVMRETPPPAMPLQPAFVPDVEPTGRMRSHGWIRLAAGLAIPVALSGGWFWQHRTTRVAPAPIDLATRAGERRAVTLADRTHIEIAGATHVSVTAGGREATLLSGRATFHVVHDAAHPFSVAVGDVTVTDVGTVFDLHRRDDGADIAVAEGAVWIERAGVGQRVSAGQIATLSDHAPAYVAAIAPAAVGGWRQGRFDYADATIAQVAADLGAATGVSITASPAVARKRFAGSVQVTGTPGQALHTVAPVLGVSVRAVGNGWELDRPVDAARR